jgi:hypothetical protein
VDAFTVVSFAVVVGFFATAAGMALVSRRSARDILDWKPTRTPEAEASGEADDLEQMVAAQNRLRRRRGAPERTLEDVERELGA